MESPKAKGKKHGRDLMKGKRYLANNRKARNKVRKITRHLKTQPNDLQSKSRLQSWQSQI